MKENNPPVLDRLTGSFLISTQNMPDPRFEEQVIYICAHSEDGAMGLTINKPNNMFSLAEILTSANLPIPENELPPVYIGGPVELESAFILFTSDYRTEYQLEVTPTTFLSRETKILEDIAHGKGPEKYLFLLGYAGWGPGQLENELLADGWLTVPGNDMIIFDTPDEEKWRAAAMLYGIDISVFGDVIGRA
ncbi:YqgE/AlgH family protein [Desulfopila inferna]|uniref:YqgE/AlgH family protein n=1 Tax=Desulfopila inferna TaxID=468528 RepID=UPI0019663578|nr:YqgE/AlgH family protein [Desulfopila inferna]MBM9602743.1 YqgE/AlgH family protein [Desulfopila inferna]